MLGDSGGEAPGKTILWKVMNRSNDINVICINQSTSILPMSISLVSLVVLGIFGRNTGFGPSMSLNNRTFLCFIFSENMYLIAPWFWRHVRICENMWDCVRICERNTFSPRFRRHDETRGRRVERSDVLVSVAGWLLCDRYFVLSHIFTSCCWKKEIFTSYFILSHIDI